MEPSHGAGSRVEYQGCKLAGHLRIRTQSLMSRQPCAPSWRILDQLNFRNAFARVRGSPSEWPVIRPQSRIGSCQISANTTRLSASNLGLSAATRAEVRIECFYSALRATIGSRRDARQAGHRDNYARKVRQCGPSQSTPGWSAIRKPSGNGVRGNQKCEQSSTGRTRVPATDALPRRSRNQRLADLPSQPCGRYLQSS